MKRFVDDYRCGSCHSESLEIKIFHVSSAKKYCQMMPRDWAAEEIYSDIDPIAKLDVRISFSSAKLAPHSPLKSTRINRLVHARKLSSLEQDMILNSRRRPIKSIHRQFIWTRVHTQSLATDTRRATTKKHFKTKKIHVFLLFQFTPQNGTYTLSRSSQPATGKTRNRIRFLSYLFRRIFFFFCSLSVASFRFICE